MNTDSLRDFDRDISHINDDGKLGRPVKEVFDKYIHRGKAIFPLRYSITEERIRPAGPSKLAFAIELKSGIEGIPSCISNLTHRDRVKAKFINLDTENLTVDFVIYQPNPLPYKSSIREKYNTLRTFTALGYDMLYRIESDTTSSERRKISSHFMFSLGPNNDSRIQQLKNDFNLLIDPRNLSSLREIFPSYDPNKLGLMKLALPFNPALRHEARKQIPEIRNYWF